MKFPDYINILRKHFKKSISTEELCRILFDSIIIPANLTDSHGEILTIGKAEISRIMNSKKNIPVQLQDHVYDNEVLESMNTYFQDNIVTELVPDTADLLHQILQLIDTDTDISPSHRASLHLQATSSMISLFLADVFIYVLRKDNKSTTTEKTTPAVNDTASTTPDMPDISLCGITLNGEISDWAEMASFQVRDKYSIEEYEEKIANMYQQASSLHCMREEIDTNYSIVKQLGIPAVMQAMYPYEDISERDKIIMREYAEEHYISIPENFFSLGNLRRANTLSIGASPEYFGTSNEKKKLEILETLPDYINRYNKLKVIDQEFKDVLFIRLAMQNIGKSVAEDMRIRLKFSANAFFEANDMAYLDEDALHLIFDDFKCDTFFEIERTANYLSYYSSIAVTPTPNYIPRISLFHEKRDFAEEWRDYFPYYVERKGNDILLDLRMDEIMHHTIVAFPTVLLFKNYIPSIDYTISCRQLPDVKTGTINIKSI